MAGKARDRRSAGAAGVQKAVNDVVARRRKPRWTRRLPGADKGRDTTDPGVGLEVAQGYETP